MVKNHFIIGYAGNKRNECPSIFKHLQNEEKNILDGIETIVEPFCGSSAFSCYLSKLYPKRFKYILNDNDSNLMKIYELMKNENEFKIFIENVNKTAFDSSGIFINKTEYLTINDPLIKWFIHHKFYTIRTGLYPLSGGTKRHIKFDEYLKLDIINFLRNEDVEFSNSNGTDVLIKYKEDEKALIFLDPPYLLSCNSYYDLPTYHNLNIYEYLHFYKEELKCKLMAVLEDMWIIQLLFKGWNKSSYDKKYEGSKKKTIHAIYSNF